MEGAPMFMKITENNMLDDWSILWTLSHAPPPTHTESKPFFFFAYDNAASKFRRILNASFRHHDLLLWLRLREAAAYNFDPEGQTKCLHQVQQIFRLHFENLSPMKCRYVCS